MKHQENQRLSFLQCSISTDTQVQRSHKNRIVQQSCYDFLYSLCLFYASIRINRYPLCLFSTSIRINRVHFCQHYSRHIPYNNRIIQLYNPRSTSLVLRLFEDHKVREAKNPQAHCHEDTKSEEITSFQTRLVLFLGID